MPRLLCVLLGLALLSLLGCGAARPTAQPLADRAPEVPLFDLPDLEGRVLRDLNGVRRKHGRAPLVPDPALTALARAHSADMRDRSFLAHRNPDGHDSGARARLAGYGFRSFGENLFRGRLYDTVNHIRRGDHTTTTYLWHTPEELAALVVAMWMESPGHRGTMLSPDFDFGGVGIAVGAEYAVFVTLNLSAR